MLKLNERKRYILDFTQVSLLNFTGGFGGKGDAVKNTKTPFSKST